jgi:hypothetical protein
MIALLRALFLRPYCCRSAGEDPGAEDDPEKIVVITLFNMCQILARISALELQRPTELQSCRIYSCLDRESSKGTLR